MSQDLMNQIVKDSEGTTATVKEFVEAYRRAHPAWTIQAKDYGNQVFVGNNNGTGINLDKVE